MQYNVYVESVTRLFERGQEVTQPGMKGCAFALGEATMDGWALYQSIVQEVRLERKKDFRIFRRLLEERDEVVQVYPRDDWIEPEASEYTQCVNKLAQLQQLTLPQRQQRTSEYKRYYEKWQSRYYGKFGFELPRTLDMKLDGVTDFLSGVTDCTVEARWALYDSSGLVLGWNHDVVPAQSENEAWDSILVLYNARMQWPLLRKDPEDKWHLVVKGTEFSCRRFVSLVLERVHESVLARYECYVCEN